jgi:hypothetical protein
LPNVDNFVNLEMFMFAERGSTSIAVRREVLFLRSPRSVRFVDATIHAA